MKPVYCISGLGADSRIFQKLDLPEDAVHHLKWLDPFSDESLQHYAGRMAGSISSDDAILIGVSFGGMLAVEIAKQKPVDSVILISSISSSKQLPFWMKCLGFLQADRILPSKPLKNLKGWKALRPIQNFFLGTCTDEDKMIANAYRDSVDPHYLKWAINKILNWKNEWVPPKCYHIHGTNDHIFSIRKIRASHVIRSGGHFMVMNRCSEINKILHEIL